MLSRDEVRRAEFKVAEGVRKLYQSVVDSKEHKIEYDQEGICIKALTPEDIATLNPSIKSNFPDGLKEGVTLVFFQEGFVPYPTVRYMAEENVNSLCDAALRLPNGAGGDQSAIKELKEQQHAFIKAELDKMGVKYRGSYQAELTSYEKSLAELQALQTKAKDSPVDPDQLQSKKIECDKQKEILDEKKAQALENFHDDAKALMKKQASQTLQGLYKLHQAQEKIDQDLKGPQDSKEKGLSFEKYSKELLESSSHHRSNSRAVLTFDLATKAFSYDESSAVTAHDRNLDSGCANLSLVFEGNFNDENYSQENAFKVNTCYTKHASLVPIDRLGKYHMVASESDIEVLADTCLNAKEVMENLARLRQHGRDEKPEGPTSIAWTYQLLTSNFGNSEKQATSYGYAVSALQLMDGFTLGAGDNQVTVEASLMNAGINKLGDVNSRAYKQNTQRRENRKAYIQLTDAVANLKFDAKNFPGIAKHVQSLQEKLSPKAPVPLAVRSDNKEIFSNAYEKKVARAYQKARTIQHDIKDNSKKFATALEVYRTARENYKTDSTNPKKLEAFRNAKREIQKLHKTAASLHEKLRHQTYTIENHRIKHWQAHKTAITENIDAIRTYIGINKDSLMEKLKGPEAEETERELRSLAALMYKSYADDLYYSGEYRDPEKAALFNSYLVSYQRAVGLMPSFGCKSGNDRTFVLRELVAATEGRPLAADPTVGESPLLPERLHDQSELMGKTKDNMAASLFSNSSGFTTIADTAGGTPKVNASKFSLLKSVSNINFISKFGKYAAHKMKSMIEKMKPDTPVIEATVDSKSSIDSNKRTSLEMPKLRSR